MRRLLPRGTRIVYASNRRRIKIALLVFATLLANSRSLYASAPLESLDRGLVALTQPDGDVFLSWRLLGTDPRSVTFNVYRQTHGNAVRLNVAPIWNATNYVATADALSDVNTGDEAHVEYFVRAIADGREGVSSKEAIAWAGHLEIPIQLIDGYRPGDASVGDLDGDGQYEIVLHQMSRPRDNSHEGLTGKPILDAYKLDGTHLWRIDLGHNIREGEHYTQFMVFDLDGDGRAEVACKTADGSKDAIGTVIGDATSDFRVRDETDKRFGRVLSGPGIPLDLRRQDRSSFEDSRLLTGS